MTCAVPPAAQRRWSGREPSTRCVGPHGRCSAASVARSRRVQASRRSNERPPGCPRPGGRATVCVSLTPHPPSQGGFAARCAPGGAPPARASALRASVPCAGGHCCAPQAVAAGVATLCPLHLSSPPARPGAPSRAAAALGASAAPLLGAPPICPQGLPEATEAGNLLNSRSRHELARWCRRFSPGPGERYAPCSPPAACGGFRALRAARHAFPARNGEYSRAFEPVKGKPRKRGGSAPLDGTGGAS